MMKLCTKCNLTQPLTDFHREVSRPTGRAHYCKTCAKAKAVAWNAANKERKAAAGLAWYHANLEKARESNARSKAKNPEANRESRRRAREKFKTERRPEYLARKSLEQSKRRVTGDDARFAAVLVRDPCSYCGKAGGTVDHVTSLAMGGSNEWPNLTGACLPCNASKGKRSMLMHMLTSASRPVRA